jgi:hypothetical protein
MRFLNILLVCMAIGVLATGAYVLGSKVKRDADDELTTPVTASAAAATAESNLKPALYAANAYYVDHSTYQGMTADVLRAEYDAGLSPALEIADAGQTSFCVQIEVADRTFSYRDRGGAVAPGNGC